MNPRFAHHTGQLRKYPSRSDVIDSRSTRTEATFVLVIVLSGPVYSRADGGPWKRWETSTRVLVALFAALGTLIWLYKLVAALLVR